MKKIYLKEDINPDYYSIVEEYNKLMDKWNKINSKINNFKIPKLLLFFTKRKLKKIFKEGADLQKEYLNWNKKARNFLRAPKYLFEKEQEGKELAYLHFTNNLHFLIDSMHEYMVLLVTNYNNRYSQYREQLNYIIAIIAFLIGIFSFGLSSYPTFFKTDKPYQRFNKFILLELDTVKNKLDSLSIIQENILKKENINQNILLKLNNVKPNKQFNVDVNTRGIN